MKQVLTVAATVLFCAATLLVLPVYAETVDYTYSVVNAPGGIGDYSWTVETTGFIEPPPAPVYQCIENCNESPEHWIRQCVEYCSGVDLFTSFASESAPSNGGGCQITGAWMIPSYSITTEFSPLCGGMYDATSAGEMPDPGTLGTWNWTWGSGAEKTDAMLTITDPVGTPEPSTWALLGLGMLGLAGAKRKERLCQIAQ